MFSLPHYPESSSKIKSSPPTLFTNRKLFHPAFGRSIVVSPERCFINTPCVTTTISFLRSSADSRSSNLWYKNFLTAAALDCTAEFSASYLPSFKFQLGGNVEKSRFGNSSTNIDVSLAVSHGNA